jgi:hypothetical protein
MIVVWLGVGKYRKRLVDFFEQYGSDNGWIKRIIDCLTICILCDTYV